MDHPDGSQISTRINVLSHRLLIEPRDAAPGQTIEVSSTDFGAPSTGGSGSGKRSEITGDQDSYVGLNGIRLKKPVVNYPINIDRTVAF